MPRYLLDVNVLLALFDPSHPRHNDCHEWISTQGSFAWASCPMSENGFARVISNPKYPGIETTPSDALAYLSKFVASSDHTFWPDSISLREFNLSRFSPKQITDAYFVLLAFNNQGILATLDKRLINARENTPQADHIELISD
ncbi:TA system VapC family ribonuclease toxin [Pelagicoccus mobilis]|uniref:Ribonuclease VapC n=1 Tax=Pelagicoccus mobilis TaxID=415221 RepID=A0A934RSL1_9BACT|nr:TA system VapC family ribonuclease toxin [Pelagicoccus mobilis]MBK1875668.1 hypothetical protein [Pelagicoccus mobilis]